MITLEAPFYEYKGAVVLRDHVDPLRYYVLPTKPRFSPVEVGTEEDGTVVTRPAVRFIKYKADLEDYDPSANTPTGGGLLWGDVDLGFEEGFLDDLASWLQQTAGLDQRPTVTFPLWESGTVRFVLLGAASETPDDDEADSVDGTPPSEGPSDWVRSFQAGGVPSLIGDNRAIFQAAVSKQGASFIGKSFAGGPITPVGVVYVLKFLAMRPAFRVRVEADWSRVFSHFDESFKADFIFFEADISKVIQELEHDEVIKIITEINDPESAEQARMAREELKARLTDAFFEPTLSPDPNAGRNPEDRVIDTLRGIRALAYPRVGYTRRSVDLEEHRSFDAEMSEIRAVERTIAPQGHLSVLFEDAGLRLDDVVEEIDLTDPFFQTFQLEVVTTDDWETTGVEMVTAQVEYAGVQKTCSFDAAGQRKTLIWDFDEEVGYSYRVRWEALYRSSAPPGPDRIGSLEGDEGWTERSGGPLALDPTEHLKLHSVRVIPLANLDFAETPVVEVSLSVEDPRGPIHRHSVFLREGELEVQPWLLRLPVNHPIDLRAEVTWHRTSAPSIVQELEAGTNTSVAIGKPHSAQLGVWLKVERSRIPVDSVIVDLEYEDPDNDMFFSDTIEFTGDSMYERRTVEIPIADAERTTWRYRQVVFVGGDAPTVYESDWVSTIARGIRVGERSARTVELAIGTEASPSFEESDIESIDVRLEWGEGDELEVSEWTCHAAGEVRRERRVFPDTTPRDATVSLSYRTTNGRRLNRGPFRMDGRSFRFAVSPEA